jgi:pimeloyl-ACP methyl ester carboxylesterase
MTIWLLRLIGGLLLLTAIALALSRAPDRPVQTLVARWAMPPSDFIDVKGQTVHVRDVGPKDDPLPLVLLHGTSASLHTWEGWVRELQGRRRIITFDLPGFGLTGPFTGAYAPGDYSGDAYARFMVDLLDTLRLQQVVLGGNSLGGEIAWRTAVLAPQRVQRLILVDALGPAFTSKSLPLGFTIARIPALNRITEWVLPRSLVAQGLADVYGDPGKVTAELVDRYFELTLREGNRRALGQRMRHLVNGEGAERIKTIRQPTLILWGGRDELIPPDIARIFQRDIQGSELVIFDPLGHVPHEEDPQQSVQPVKRFLEWPSL